VKIEAGKLDRRIELLAVTKGKSTVGQVMKDFAPFATVYAERLELRTQDAARAGQRDTYSTSRYKIRYRADLTTSMRVRVDGVLYDIVAIDQPPPRRSVLVLTVEEVAAATVKRP
jgi:SPP1 family predicted phage head-tail adaptor